jgi:hypothetical protein
LYSSHLFHKPINSRAVRFVNVFLGDDRAQVLTADLRALLVEDVDMQFAIADVGICDLPQATSKR